jgi:hypothetical protein
MDVEAHSITLISIIVGLGLTEMFGNLHRLIRNRERVRWDALPLAWVATLFLLVINYWWALYLHLDGSTQARTAAQMGLSLAAPILLFLATASVLPHFEPDEKWDMRRHYDRQRKVFILTFALYQVCTFTTALIVGSMSWDYLAVVRVVIFALLVSTLATNNRRWDWAAVLAIFAFLCVRLTMQVVR